MIDGIISGQVLVTVGLLAVVGLVTDAERPHLSRLIS